MHILLLTDNFIPETNSPATRAYEHAKAWRRAGVDVTVITSVPNFPIGRPLPPYRNRPYQRETIDGISVIRVWTFLAPNRGILLRSIDFLSFSVSALLAGLFQQADVIVATSPQLLTGMAAWWLAVLKRRPWVLEVRDLWPDSIVSVGAMDRNLFIRALAVLERNLYNHANRIIAVSDGVRERLLAKAVPPQKIGVVWNGVDLSRAAPRTPSAPLIESLNFRGSFVVGYVGTHGMAQALEVVLDAARILHGNNVRFLFVGEGARREALLSYAAELKLENARFVGLVPLETAAEHIAICDAILIPLKRTDQIEITIPAKIFEAAAMEKPMIVAAEGASADLILRYGAGLVVPPEDPSSLAAAITQLRDDQGLREQLKAGCRALAYDFNRQKLALDMLQHIRLALPSAS